MYTSLGSWGVVMGFFIDHHTIIEITIFGMVVDVLGGLFLAYELLGGRKGPLRTLTRVLGYGVLGVSLSLVGVAVAFPAAIQFHFKILTILGMSGTFGLLFGYMIGWGFGSVMGYLLTIPHEESSKTKCLSHDLKKASKPLIILLLGLLFWFARMISFTARIRKGTVRKTILLIGCSLMAGIVCGFLMKKRMPPRIIENPLLKPDRQPVDDLEKHPQVETAHSATYSKVRTRRVRIVAGFGVGVVMGLLFWLGGIITLDYRLIHGLASGILAGLIAGLINGFVFGFLVRYYLIKIVDIDAPLKPSLDVFDILLGAVVTFTIAVFYGFAIWFLFGGNLVNLLLVGSIVGLLGGLGGGILLSIVPLLEWKVYNLPEKQLGTIGAFLLVLGFLLQSLQYWINLFDIHLR